MLTDAPLYSQFSFCSFKHLIHKSAESQAIEAPSDAKPGESPTMLSKTVWHHWYSMISLDIRLSCAFGSGGVSTTSRHTLACKDVSTCCWKCQVILSRRSTNIIEHPHRTASHYCCLVPSWMQCGLAYLTTLLYLAAGLPLKDLGLVPPCRLGQPPPRRVCQSCPAKAVLWEAP